VQCIRANDFHLQTVEKCRGDKGPKGTSRFKRSLQFVQIYLDSIGIVGYLADKLESANQILSFPWPCVSWQFEMTHASRVSLCRQRLEPL